MTTYAENMSDEARAYYGEKGWRRTTINGVPCRVRAFADAKSRRALKAIKAAVKTGASIDKDPDAPRFRYIPIELPADPFGFRQPDAGPSKRKLFNFPNNKGRFKTWSPAKIESNGDYTVPMRGDDHEMTRARREYAEGDPTSLRKLLAARAAERRATNDNLAATDAA